MNQARLSSALLNFASWVIFKVNYDFLLQLSDVLFAVFKFLFSGEKLFIPWVAGPNVG
jgi:hypothetical protein